MGNKEFRETMIGNREGIYRMLGKDAISIQEATALATVDALKIISQRNLGKVSAEEQNMIDQKISKRIQRVFSSNWYLNGIKNYEPISWAREETE
jgi:hypothetical protein